MTEQQSSPDIAVYTAIFDDYDVLIDPEVTEPNVDYICFTDNESITSNFWEIRNVKPMVDPQLSNRRIKILAHEYLDDYDISVYIDGNIQVKSPIEPMVEKYLSSVDFALYEHPERTSLFKEGDACIEKNKSEEVAIRSQLEYYRNVGFPDDQGLSENRILFRRHQSPQIKDLMWSWWREVSERVSRDQLSLMFVLWKHDAEYTMISHPVRDAPQFVIYPHRPDGYLGLFWPYWIDIKTDPNRGNLKTFIYYSMKSASILKKDGIRSLSSSLTSFFTSRAQQFGDKLGLIGPSQIYSSNYYEKRRQDPFRSESHNIVDVIVKQLQPSSVIDFGCAIGTYLERFDEHGVSIHGVEGNSEAFKHAVIPDDRLEQHDLREPYDADKYYDLVLSVEVAEHIPEKYVRTFVNTLVDSGKVVILTAAPPGQGGTHHVNEKPPEYWIEIFNDFGMDYDHETTNKLKQQISVDSLYHVPENMLVFR